MGGHHETYKGREIHVREAPSARAAPEARSRRAADDAPEADAGGPPAASELAIDGEPVVTVRDRSGVYRAANFMYAPEPSLVDLAKRMIDYEDAARGGAEHGTSQEPEPPQHR